MIGMPLIGWAMLSAAAYPVVLFGSVHLPAILPQSDSLHTLLWNAHFYLAFVFFALILLHVAAGLFHALVRRDGRYSTRWRRCRFTTTSHPPSDTGSRTAFHPLQKFKLRHYPRGRWADTSRKLFHLPGLGNRRMQRCSVSQRNVNCSPFRKASRTGANASNKTRYPLPPSIFS